MDEQRPCRTLVNLQLRLIESKETNAEFSKQIDQLQVVKEELSQSLANLKLSSKKEAIESLLEDREIVALSNERENALIKHKSLTNDLRSARNLLRKFKLDIDCSRKSISKLEVTLDVIWFDFDLCSLYYVKKHCKQMVTHAIVDFRFASGTFT